MESTLEGQPSERRGEQYSLAQILGIWALAAAPIGVLSWIVFPLVAPDFESDPLAFGVTRVVLFTLGLIWLFVLSMIIVRREEGDLRWASVKRRLRLNTPRKALVVAGAVPRCGHDGRTCTFVAQFGTYLEYPNSFSTHLGG